MTGLSSVYRAKYQHIPINEQTEVELRNQVNCVDGRIKAAENNADLNNVIYYCKNKNSQMVEAIIVSRTRGTIDLNRWGHDGTTALGSAVENNDLPMIKLLVGYGADMHAPDRSGMTPYQRAAGKATIVEALDNTKGGTSLYYDQYISCYSSGADVAIFEGALAKGRVYPNMEGANKNTPLAAAVQHGDLRKIATLIAHGANIHQYCAYYKATPYQLAMQSNESLVMIFFDWAKQAHFPEPPPQILQAPPNLTIASTEPSFGYLAPSPMIAQTPPIEQSVIGLGGWEARGRSELLVAVCAWDLDGVKAALKQPDVHVNEQDPKGRTALTAASENGAGADLVQLLLGRGADQDALDGNARSARQIAKEKGYQWLTDLFAQWVPMGVRLMSSIDAGDYWATKALLDSNADINGMDGMGRTPLTAACRNRAPVNLMVLLMKYGADEDAEDGNGSSARQIAEAYDYHELSASFAPPKQ
jgi:ankyrin repeat protein